MREKRKEPDEKMNEWMKLLISLYLSLCLSLSLSLCLTCLCSLIVKFFLFSFSFLSSYLILLILSSPSPFLTNQSYLYFTSLILSLLILLTSPSSSPSSRTCSLPLSFLHLVLSTFSLRLDLFSLTYSLSPIMRKKEKRNKLSHGRQFFVTSL